MKRFLSILCFLVASSAVAGEAKCPNLVGTFKGKLIWYQGEVIEKSIKIEQTECREITISEPDTFNRPDEYPVPVSQTLPIGQTMSQTLPTGGVINYTANYVGDSLEVLIKWGGAYAGSQSDVYSVKNNKLTLKNKVNGQEAVFKGVRQ